MSKSGKKIALGAVIAGVVGYLAGLLTAPKSGKETRKDISDTAKKAKVAGERELKELHSQLNDLIEKSRTKVGKLSDAAKKDLESGLKKASVAKEKVRGVLSSLHEGVSDDKELEKAVDQATAAIKHLKQFAINQKENVKKV
ncbi:MAG TPA: YtxH domain-containing protein [Patescibacteria group bacterium]|nr:YtxH domain-containing protein [Patescibacteria group bacterium]